MVYRSRRQGAGIGRGGAIALILGAVIVAAALWLGPLRPLPAELRLLALSESGEFAEHIQAAVRRPDTLAAAADAVARAPLILALQNVGARPATPSVLRVSVPGRFRLTGPDGEPLPTRSMAGTPLTQYEFDLEFPTLQPNDMPVILPGMDTLWIEAVLPQFHCDLIADAVPEFIPAPRYDPATLSTVRLFYALDGVGRERQSGLLTLDFDPAMLTRDPAGQPMRSRVSMHPDAAPRPDLGPLTQIGSRSASCGDPGLALDLHTVLWEGQTGGWMYEVHVRDEPRKLVYDLNRDGRVDLEIWDTEGDGGFRASREVNYPVPSFLRPLPQRLALPPEEIDPMWLARFQAVQQGPYRFADRPPQLATTEQPAAPPPAAPPTAPPPGIAMPVDSAWLARFNDAAAGPYRFAAAPPAVPAAPVETPPAAPGEPPVAQPAPPPVAADTPAPTPPPATPAPRPPPRLLGEPVPWPPRDPTPRN
jgi:hypothetical protein